MTLVPDPRLTAYVKESLKANMEYRLLQGSDGRIHEIDLAEITAAAVLRWLNEAKLDQALGYMVLTATPQLNGEESWNADWDGDFHLTLEAVNKAAAAALAVGERIKVVACHEVTALDLQR